MQALLNGIIIIDSLIKKPSYLVKDKKRKLVKSIDEKPPNQIKKTKKKN